MSQNFKNTLYNHLNRTAAITRLDPELFNTTEEAGSSAPTDQLSPEEESNWNYILGLSITAAIAGLALLLTVLSMDPECKRHIANLKEKLNQFDGWVSSGPNSMMNDVALEIIRTIMKNMPQRCRDKVLRDESLQPQLRMWARIAGTTVHDLVNKFLMEASDAAALAWLKSLGTKAAVQMAIVMWARQQRYSADVAAELISWANTNKAWIIATIAALGLTALVSGILSGGESPISAPAGLSAVVLASFLLWFYGNTQIEEATNNA